MIFFFLLSFPYIASDIAENPYWKRDVRRAYPQLSVVTQEQLSTFLLQKPEQPAYVPFICTHLPQIQKLTCTYMQMFVEI